MEKLNNDLYSDILKTIEKNLKEKSDKIINGIIENKICDIRSKLQIEAGEQILKAMQSISVTQSFEKDMMNIIVTVNF